MTSSETGSAWKSFLETTPPNTPETFSGLIWSVHRQNMWVPGIRNPAIKLYCERDDGFRRFDPSGNIHGISKQRYHFIRYQCRDCGSIEKTIALLVDYSEDSSEVEVMKRGEYPPFSAPISSRIQKLLCDSDLELYRKGVRSEAQGLGIGTATYFRRIVEGQWQRLVKEIQEAAKRLGVEDLRVYDAALREKQFSRAVAMLKDVIPGKLLILDGQNPLTLLHKPLSRQLHELTDEECLQQAADIRVVLTALLENIADVLKDQDELSAAAARLRSGSARS